MPAIFSLCVVSGRMNQCWCFCHRGVDFLSTWMSIYISHLFPPVPEAFLFLRKNGTTSKAIAIRLPGLVFPINLEMIWMGFVSDLDGIPWCRNSVSERICFHCTVGQIYWRDFDKGFWPQGETCIEWFQNHSNGFIFMVVTKGVNQFRGIRIKFNCTRIDLEASRLLWFVLSKIDKFTQKLV